MKHHDKKRKFGRERGQRRELLRSLAVSLIEHGSIETSLAKAKELRPYVEKLVTRGKTNSIASRRMLLSRIHSDDAVGKLLKDIGPKYKDRSGGYTRIVKTGKTMSDKSPRAIIAFV